MLITLLIECEKLFNFNSHNYRISGNKNLRDIPKTKCMNCYLAQDNNITGIYKHIGISKRLNVAGCCMFSVVGEFFI